MTLRADELQAVPDQRNLALMNTYIASTTKTLNQLAAVCERNVHEVDRRCSLESYSTNGKLGCAWINLAV